MIRDEDISIVVQGPIIFRSAYEITSTVTQCVCQRLKELFPKSELILSTWEGENVEGIPFDVLLLNKDPGATWFDYKDPHLLNNCNRLIVSTFAGLKAASRQYVLKVRSDTFLVSKRFLHFFYRYPLYNDEYKFVENRIICFALNTLYGHKTPLFTMHRPYHISDWAYFGYRNDLINLFDIPLTTEPDFSQWFLTHCKPFFDIEPWRLWKMPPEQYITLNFLKKFIAIDLDHTADISGNNIEMSSKLLINNFLILDQTQFFLISLKYLYFAFSSYKGYEWYISYRDWLKHYHDYMKMTPLRKIQIKIIIAFRGLRIPLSKLLRFLNQKNQMICRLYAFFIKKSNQRKTDDTR